MTNQIHRVYLQPANKNPNLNFQHQTQSHADPQSESIATPSRTVVHARSRSSSLAALLLLDPSAAEPVLACRRAPFAAHTSICTEPVALSLIKREERNMKMEEKEKEKGPKREMKSVPATDATDRTASSSQAQPHGPLLSITSPPHQAAALP
ncbi:hypothetical protein M0R45_034922 [Rubus argutus]|uniref:Uncharacterized protein n=1 Tax=Rubus argutus TaxID=59490 RepID=A0AAW1VVC5_RUBAR